MIERAGMLRVLGALCLMVGARFLPGIAAAQVIPVGTEFQVNTYTTSFQVFPQICRAPDGRFTVIFESGGDHDGDGTGIFGQRYGSDGSRAGTEFQVNTYTRGAQGEPSVCCDAAGNFVVAWQSFGQDGGGDGVFGQRFASSGGFRGTEFQVNTYTNSDNRYPSICCAADGDFVVAWQSYRQDGGADGVFGQRFASNGDALGKEFQVNTYTSGFQEEPAICCDTAGDFVVAWQSEKQDGSREGVFAQRFAAGGTRQGTEFQVNTYTSLSQEAPAVCCSGNGGFTVVWDSFRQDGFQHGIFGQQFAETGLARGQEFQVNTYTTSEQTIPSVCCGPDGSFVVAWQSLDQDGSSYGVFARHFNAGGGAMPELQVNTYTTGNQGSPAVACDAKGNFVVVWRSDVLPPWYADSQDGDSAGVFGRRFEILGTVATPMLSFAGLALSAIALFGTGVLVLRRRRAR